MFSRHRRTPSHGSWYIYGHRQNRCMKYILQCPLSWYLIFNKYLRRRYILFKFKIGMILIHFYLIPYILSTEYILTLVASFLSSFAIIHVDNSVWSADRICIFWTVGRTGKGTPSLCLNEQSIVNMSITIGW